MDSRTDGHSQWQAGDSSGRMRCLVLVPSLIRAGAETQAVDLANGLAGRGHEVHLCSFESPLDQRARLSTRVRFHHVPRRSKYDVTLISRLAALVDAERVDVIQGVLAMGTLVAWLASRRSIRRPPVVAAIHTTLPRNRKDAFYERIVYRRVLRRLPAVEFVCDHQRNYWVRKYPELAGVAVTVHNGVAPERFIKDDFVDEARKLRSEQNIPAESFVFACIAAFRPEKGHDLLLRGFSEVSRHAYLVLAGDGEKRDEMQRLATAMGLGPRTRFLGSIPDSRPLIAASQATVLASTAVETFSMAMLESMAMGVPMIAPRIGGLPEAIVHGSTGLLFPIADVRSLGKCMRTLAEQPDVAEELGQAARSKVIAEFTLDKMTRGCERVLRSVGLEGGESVTKASHTDNERDGESR